MTRKEFLAPIYAHLAAEDQALTIFTLASHDWQIEPAAKELAISPDDLRCLIATYSIEVPQTVTQ